MLYTGLHHFSVHRSYPFSRHASPYGHYTTCSNAHNSRHTYDSSTPLLIHYTQEFTICCMPIFPGGTSLCCQQWQACRRRNKANGYHSMHRYGLITVWLYSSTSNVIETHPFNTRTTSSNTVDFVITSNLKRGNHVVDCSLSMELTHFRILHTSSIISLLRICIIAVWPFKQLVSPSWNPNRWTAHWCPRA